MVYIFFGGIFIRLNMKIRYIYLTDCFEFADGVYAAVGEFGDVTEGVAFAD